MKESAARAPKLGEEDPNSAIRAILNDVNSYAEREEAVSGSIVQKEPLTVEKDLEESGRGGVEPHKPDRKIYVPVTASVYHPFLFHSDTPLPCMVVVPENLGCSTDCGAPDPDQPVLSKLLSGNPQLFSTVFMLRKKVIDYVFHTSGELQNM